MSLRAERSSVRRSWIFMPVASASFLNSPSSLARVCQLPLTSSSMANSLPSEVMRLSLMLPPQSAIALDSSWTMPTRSLPTAEMTICFFIGANSSGWALARVYVWHLRERYFPRSSLMFAGSLVAIVTPMTADGALDWPAWDRLLDFHLREGSDGIVVAGTTGESPVLSAAEVEELTRRAVARCRDKLKVIVGAGFNSTESTVAATRSLSRLGVGAGVLGTPYFNKPPQEALFRLS